MRQNKCPLFANVDVGVSWVPMSSLLAIILSLSLGLTLETLDARAQEGRRTQKRAISAETENNGLATTHSIQSQSGRISYMEQGKGPVALFVHGVLLNSYL